MDIKSLIMPLLVFVLFSFNTVNSVQPLANLAGAKITVNWGVGSATATIPGSTVGLIISNPSTADSATFFLIGANTGLSGASASWLIQNSSNSAHTIASITIDLSTAIVPSVFTPSSYGNFSITSGLVTSNFKDPGTPPATRPFQLTIAPQTETLTWGTSLAQGTSYVWYNDTSVAVPEPSTYLTLAAFLAAGVLLKKRQAQKHAA